MVSDEDEYVPDPDAEYVSADAVCDPVTETTEAEEAGYCFDDDGEIKAAAETMRQRDLMQSIAKREAKLASAMEELPKPEGRTRRRRDDDSFSPPRKKSGRYDVSSPARDGQQSLFEDRTRRRRLVPVRPPPQQSDRRQSSPNPRRDTRYSPPPPNGGRHPARGQRYGYRGRPSPSPPRRRLPSPNRHLPPPPLKHALHRHHSDNMMMHHARRRGDYQSLPLGPPQRRR